MDFFDHQEAAKRRTRWLITYFAAAVAGIILVLYAAAILVIQVAGQNRLSPMRGFKPSPALELESTGKSSWWAPWVLFWVATGAVGVISTGSLYKISQLSGGSALAASLGGRRLDPNTPDPAERRLLNIVEEMSIASGVPMPEVFLLANEKSINAFAAGHSISDAAIGVTDGCLNALSRDELQGVIAHEFSHILNGDMRLNTRLIGLVHGILAIAIGGRILARVGREAEGRVGLVFLAGGAFLFVVGYLGVFFGRLIKSAVARQREFLADAAAVQFTRLPEGLAGALKKIGGLSSAGHLRTPQAEEASHLFFTNALSPSWMRWMSTHPPLIDRIRRWDPSFDGRFEPTSQGQESAGTMGFTPLSRPSFANSATRPALPPTASRPVTKASIVPSIGSPSARHLTWAAAMTRTIPDPLLQAVREPSGAMAAVCALLFSRDPQVAAIQEREIRARATGPLLDCWESVLAQVQGLDLPAKLPLVEIAMPALRGMDAALYHEFIDLLQSFVEADQQIDLFEYALQKMLQRHLRPRFEKVRRPIAQYYVLKPLVGASQILLSALAQIGQPDLALKRAALNNGAQELDPQGQFHWELIPIEKCNLSQIDQALNQLAEATPPLKLKLLHACVAVVSADGLVQIREAELLRAVADSLDCPLPPLLADPQIQPARMASWSDARPV